MEMGAKFTGDSEQCSGFHFKHAQVIRFLELEVKAALGLKDFAGADHVGGFSYPAADKGGGVRSGEDEGVSKKAVAQ